MKLFDYCFNPNVFKNEIRVQASGMPSIRRVSPIKARQIRRGHDLARSYTTATLLNLDRLFSDSRLDSRRRLFVEQFFDTSPVSAVTLEKIRVLTRQLLEELLDPSLDPETSPRYVVGSAVHPQHGIQAFIVLNEPVRRIYLTEAFFDPGFNKYLPIRPRTFDMLGHNMASVLLHEISHLVLDTLDLAYLNASHPFLDLLETVTPGGKYRYRGLEQLQKNALSSTTPANELFRRIDDYDLNWHDFVGKPLQRILQMTGTRDLDDARRVFYSDENKRVDVILSNADSLTLLIAHLGRPAEFNPLH
ncbi:hypothetical protein AWM79_21640 [Pseudomonas agarici]|uniref:Uncharacterized protein n=1 Tax=Pseudomonas agarici TaxID=46677 RepID=A0A0X1T6L1_PSEAA|nr:hypothetical protein [Pseudomonas agarici]AMB87747.1 hypothetical protein AWM79_21640 [Pseudomonas agarici]NWB91561.1 hypothetical protein [Pseudomonas agarici]NWC10947.1 hypothetical protein [Pseudomonas agarici]SEK89441.1 hypothetical protein SAMN05216604_10815 [Pseudomonas agarici]